MSSHHIVRENQEPALIFCSVHALSKEYLGQLLEWSPTLLTDAFTVDFLLADEIKVDVVFSDDKLVLPQEQIKLLPLAGHFMASAMNYLKKHNYAAVNILCDVIDESLFSFAAEINVVVFCQSRRYVFVRNSYEKWKPGQEQIYIEDNFVKSYTGLRKVADHTYMTISDGFFGIDFATADLVLLGEDL